jgi:uncharacterized membrane protein
LANIKKSIFINAPVSKVHDIARDPNNWSSLIAGLGEAERVEGDGGAGTRTKHLYTMAGVSMPVETEVTLDRTNEDGSWSNHNEFSGPLSGWQTWEYRPKDGGTEVTAEVEYTVPGKVLGKFADKLIVERMQERSAEESLERLKLLVEGTP